VTFVTCLNRRRCVLLFSASCPAHSKQPCRLFATGARRDWTTRYCLNESDHGRTGGRSGRASPQCIAISLGATDVGVSKRLCVSVPVSPALVVHIRSPLHAPTRRPVRRRRRGEKTARPTAPFPRRHAPAIPPSGAPGQGATNPKKKRRRPFFTVDRGNAGPRGGSGTAPAAGATSARRRRSPKGREWPSRPRRLQTVCHDTPSRRREEPPARPPRRAAASDFAGAARRPEFGCAP